MTRRGDKPEGPSLSPRRAESGIQFLTIRRSEKIRVLQCSFILHGQLDMLTKSGFLAPWS